MECTLCGCKIRINYGNSSAVVCENCVDAGTADELISTVPTPDNVSKKSVSKFKKLKTNYETTKFITAIIVFFGWLIVALGFAAVVAGVSTGINTKLSVALVSSLPGIGIIVSGLFLVALGQVIVATVDNADQTREILNILRNNS